MNPYFLYKSLHLISMVAWFAGLFYLVRLYVYHAEAREKPADERRVLEGQFEIMEERLFRIIVRPGMLMTWLFGGLMIYEMGVEWLTLQSWLHVKVLMVFVLSAYSDYLGKIAKKLAAGEPVMSSHKFRLLNEVPTLFLVAIVILAVYKNLTNFSLVFLGILLFGVLLFLGVRMYKRARESNNSNKL